MEQPTTNWMGFLKAALGRVKYFYLIKPLTLISNFILIAILARQLGTEQYGIIVLILAVTGVIMTVLEFRSSEATVRYFMRALGDGSRDKARGYLCLGVALDVVLAAVLALAAYFSSESIATAYFEDKNLTYAIFIYLSSGAFLFLSGTSSAVLQSREQFLTMNLLDFGHKLFRLGWVLFADLSITSVMTGYAISNLLYCLALAAAALPVVARLTRDSGFLVERAMVKEFLSFSMATFLSSLLKFGQRDIDKLILGIFATPAVIGVYDIIKRIAGLLPWVTFPFEMASYPAIVRLYRDQRYADLHERVLLGSKIALVASAGTGLMIYLFFPFLADIFAILDNEQHRFSLAILLSSYTLSNTMWFVRPVSNAYGRPRYSVIAGAIMSVSFILSLFFLVPRFGIVGASVANLFATVVISITWAKIMASLTAGWRRASV